MSTKTQVSAVTSFPAVVGAVLAAARKANKPEITQAEMAAAIGATVSTWSRIETAETAITIEQLKQAAEHLGLRASAILAAAEEKITELEGRGVSVEPKRLQMEKVVAMGAVPVIGATLAGLMGPVGLAVAGGFIAGLASSSKSKRKK